MRRVVLYQFHRAPEVCRQRVEILRALNPGASIFGVFGGSDDINLLHRPVLDVLDGPVHVLLPAGLHWWKNTDLAMRDWFRSKGCRIAFDVIHLVQWDLLYARSFEQVSADLSPTSVALTGPVPIEKISTRWHWTTSSAEAAEWERLQAWAREKHRWSKSPLACLGPGYSLPRPFLEKYSLLDLPELAHDELRLPLGAQILGFAIQDTGFYRWFDHERERVFNANNHEVTVSTIEAELADPNGCRVFHPCRTTLSQSLVERLLQVGSPCQPFNESFG